MKKGFYKKAIAQPNNLPAGRQVEKAHIASDENQGVENFAFGRSCVY